jgi:hypothetical protein
MPGVIAYVAREGKRFFFEKKNQKTFATCGTRRGTAYFNGEKFFGSFFQKRTASS